MQIQKSSDYIFRNVQNIWLIFKYYWNFLFTEENVQKIINLLDRFDSNSDAYNIKINLWILKFQWRKQYFIEVYSGYEWYYNNSFSNPHDIRFYYNHIFQLRIKEIIKAFDDKVQLLNEFYLFDDKKIKRLFDKELWETKFWKQKLWSNRATKINNTNTPEWKKTKKMLKGLADYIKQITWGDKETLEMLVNTELNDMLWFKSSITLDSFDWEAIWIWNPSIWDYNLFNVQMFAKNEKHSQRTENNKILRTYWDVKLNKLISLLDQKDRNGNEIFPKYYLKFTIANSRDDEVQSYSDGTVSFKWKKRYRFAKDNVNYFFDTWINAFLFTKKTSLVNLYEDLETLGYATHNYTSPIENSQVILQDPFYEAKSVTDKEGIKEIFNLMKAYRANKKWIKWGKEITSNNDIKYYPHDITWLDDWGFIMWAIHAALIWETGSGKTYTASYLFSQFWNDNTQALMVDDLSFEEKLHKPVWWNWSYILNPQTGVMQFVWKNKWNYELILDDINTKNNNRLYNKKEKTFYRPKLKKNKEKENENKNITIEGKGNYVKVWPDDYKKVWGFKLVGWNWRFIISKKQPIYVWEWKWTHEPITSYTRIAIGVDKINLIGKLRHWEDEIDYKTNFLCNLLGVYDLEENDMIYNPLIQKIRSYLRKLSDDPENPIFNYDRFKKEMYNWIDNLKDIDNEGMQANLIRNIVDLSKQHKDVLNSKIDFFEAISNKDRVIFQLKDIIQDKMTLIGFFQLLRAYFDYNIDTIKYCFVDELTNYYNLNDPSKEAKALGDIFEKFLRKSRNQNTGIFVMTQKSADLKWLISSIDQFLITRDEGLKQVDKLISMFNINKESNSESSKKLKKYYDFYEETLNDEEFTYVNFLWNRLDKKAEEKKKRAWDELYLLSVPSNFSQQEWF